MQDTLSASPVCPGLDKLSREKWYTHRATHSMLLNFCSNKMSKLFIFMIYKGF